MKKTEPARAKPHPLSGAKTPFGLGLLVLAVGGVSAAAVEHALDNMKEVDVGAALGRFGAVLPFICALCVVLVLGCVPGKAARAGQASSLEAPASSSPPPGRSALPDAPVL